MGFSTTFSMTSGFLGDALTDCTKTVGTDCMATARTLGTIICELAAYSVGDGAALMPGEAYMN
jgi:hypothetical protein